MNCPYCGEEVRSEALICRHCRSDLQLVCRLQARIDELEAFLASGTAKASADRPAEQRQATDSGTRASRFAPLLFVGTAATIIPALIAMNAAQDLQLLLFIGSPLILGFVAGAMFPSGGLKRFAKLGLAFTVVNLALVILVDVLLLSHTYGADDIPVVLGSGLGVVLLWTTGGVAGRWIRRRRSKSLPSFGTTVARDIEALRRLRNPESSTRVDRIARVINALAPILTFFASVLGAYLTYLAAMSKAVAAK